MEFPYAPEWDELLAIGEAIRSRLVGLRYASNRPALSNEQVFQCWAEPEDIATFPAIGIMASTGNYGGEGEQTLSPSADPGSRVPPQGNGYVLVEEGQFTAEIEILLWATDPIMRSLLVRAVRERLQDDACGVNGRSHYGVDLEVPHYFGGYASAHVSPIKIRYEDDAEDAKRRHRKAILTVRAELVMYHVESAQDLLPRLVVEYVGDEPM